MQIVLGKRRCLVWLLSFQLALSPAFAQKSSKLTEPTLDQAFREFVQQIGLDRQDVTFGEMLTFFAPSMEAKELEYYEAVLAPIWNYPVPKVSVQKQGTTWRYSPEHSVGSRPLLVVLGDSQKVMSVNNIVFTDQDVSSAEQFIELLSKAKKEKAEVSKKDEEMFKKYHRNQQLGFDSLQLQKMSESSRAEYVKLVWKILEKIENLQFAFNEAGVDTASLGPSDVGGFVGIPLLLLEKVEAATKGQKNCLFLGWDGFVTGGKCDVRASVDGAKASCSDPAQRPCSNSLFSSNPIICVNGNEGIAECVSKSIARMGTIDKGDFVKKAGEILNKAAEIEGLCKANPGRPKTKMECEALKVYLSQLQAVKDGQAECQTPSVFTITFTEKTISGKCSAQPAPASQAAQAAPSAPAAQKPTELFRNASTPVNWSKVGKYAMIGAFTLVPVAATLLGYFAQKSYLKSIAKANSKQGCGTTYLWYSNCGTTIQYSTPSPVAPVTQ